MHFGPQKPFLDPKDHFYDLGMGFAAKTRHLILMMLFSQRKMTENAFQFMETDNEGLLDVFHF